MNKISPSNCETSKIREMIAQAYPPDPYYGAVTMESYPSDVYEAAGDDLNRVLHGESWRDLYPQFVDTNQDEYVLMNGTAVVAFIAAWLWMSAEAMGSQNQVRSSLIYHLAVHGGSRNQGTGLWSRSFRALNQQQRNVIQLILTCAIKSATEEERGLIDKAIRGITENASLE